MKTYRLTAQLDMGGKRYQPGDSVELDDATAEALIAVGGILDVVVGELGDEKPTDVEITAAIQRLDPHNDQHWTKGGLPNVSAIEDALGGRNIGAADRDRVWEAVPAIQAS